MSYLGSSATPIPVAFSGVRTQSFSGTGSASLFTLNRQVNAVTDIEVIVNNVQQSPFDGSYSIVNNGLGLQFSENPSAGTNNIYVVYRDQPLGSLYDTGAVRKTGDTMTGTLTVGGNLLVSAESGGARTIGAASGTNTTVVIQGSTSIGGGPNIELTKDNVAYFDSNTIKFRSTDASLTYGGFDTAGRLTVPNQPFARASSDAFTAATNVIPLNTYAATRGGLSISSNRMTVPVAGAYVIGYHHLGNTGSGACQVQIRVNGSGLGGTSTQDTNASNDSFGTQTIAVLAANDYIEFVCIQGTTHNNPGYNSMWAYLIG